MCHPEKQVCFTSYPEMELTKIEGSCPLVPLYFAFDSTALVPERSAVGRLRRALLEGARRARVEFEGARRRPR